MLFISQTLPYSFCACVRNTPKSVTFVIGKMKLVSFGLILDASPSPRSKMPFGQRHMKLVSFGLILDAFPPPPPPRPKMPFGQRHFAINIYNICKVHFGSRGGNIYKQTERHQFHLSNDKHHILGVFRTHAQ